MALPAIDGPTRLAHAVDCLGAPSLAAVAGQRAVLFRYLRARTVPSVELVGVFGRAGGWSSTSRAPVLGVDDATRLLSHSTGDLLVMPSDSSARPWLLRRSGGDLVSPDGRRLTPRGTAAGLVADPAHELFVILEAPRVVPGVRRLLPQAALPIVRVTTLVGPGVSVVNVHLWSMGGGDAAEPPVAPVPAGDVRATVPGWRWAEELVDRAARAMMPLRTLAWDLAFTPAGPRVVDAAARYGWRDGVGHERLLATLEAELDRHRERGGR